MHLQGQLFTFCETCIGFDCVFLLIYTHPKNVYEGVMWLKRNGFTIIELMVVVAVMALLMTIIYPLMGKSVEQARRTSCKSNMNQIMACAVLYDTDFKHLPYTARAATAARPNPGDAGTFNDHTSWISDWMKIQLTEDYGLNLVTFTCPNRGEDFIKMEAGSRWRMGYYLLWGRDTYNWASPNGNQVAWESMYKLSDMESNEGIAISDIIEKGTWHPPSSSVSHSNQGMKWGEKYVEPEDNNSEGGNICRVDGSVTWRKQSEMVEHAASKGGTVSGYW